MATKNDSKLIILQSIKWKIIPAVWLSKLMKLVRPISTRNKQGYILLLVHTELEKAHILMS